jgi:hypothetical protein
MSTASLSADSAKLRGVSQKTSRRNELLYDFFIYIAFSPVWLFHLYDFFTCMTFSPVWLFHLYGFFICMRFSCVWVLFVGFARGFSSVSFHLWIISSVDYFICEVFHLWIISSVDFFCGVCERSMRAKHFYDETIII